MVRELPGRIAPTRVADVRPRVSGIVVERSFNQGSEVKAGDPLYRIDPRPFEVELQSNEAALARANAVYDQAAQQARRVAPPEIAEPIALKKAIAEERASRIVLSEAEHRVSLKRALADGTLPLAMAFGPEGGWVDTELELFRASEWKAASLGHTILRAETASIAALAVAVAELQPA